MVDEMNEFIDGDDFFGEVVLAGREADSTLAQIS
jgi:hypothetical protein